MATVLVVEDDKLSQRILQKILNGGGHTALLSAGVEEAWTRLREHVWVDLVVLDNQLGKSWGWRFLEELRQDVLYRDLPVVIYTGHTERSSILRYVELGVTSMLVKPYKAETVYDEVAKAVKLDWAGKLIENPAQACERLKIKEADYYSVLAAGATSLEKTLAELRRTVSSRHGTAPVMEVLQQIYNQSAALGMPALRTTADALAKAYTQHNSKVVQNCLQSIDSLRQLLRNRALAYVGIEEVTTKTSGSNPPAAPIEEEEADISAENAAQFYQRRIASISLLKLGTSLKRLAGGRLIKDEEWDTLLREWAGQSPFTDLIEAARYIDDAASSASMDDLESSIKAIPGFEKVFLEITQRLTAKPDADTPEAELGTAINRLGMHKTVVLTACARLVPTLRAVSVLDLGALRVHTLCTTLLAYEIARMLHLYDEPIAGSAGVVHNLGTWIFAISEPALYAAVIARASAAGCAVSEAEKEIFGRNHREVAGAILATTSLRPVVQVTAENYSTPTRIQHTDHLPIAVAVHLASELAWTIAADQERFTTKLQERLLVSENAIWTALARCRVELPMDIPEFVDVLFTAAKTAAWITNTLLEFHPETETDRGRKPVAPTKR